MYKILESSQKLLLLGFLLFPITVSAQIASAWTYPIKKCWSYDTESLTSLNLASDNSLMVVTPLDSGEIATFDIHSGHKIWSTSLGGEFSSAILVNNKSFFITNHAKVNKNSTSIISVDILSGVNNWKTKLTGGIGAETVKLFLRSDMLFIVSQNGQLIALNKSHKSISWEKKLDINISSNLTAHKDTLMFGTTDKTVIAISQKNGDILSKTLIGNIPTRISVGSGKYLSVGDRQGNIQTFDLVRKKRLWKVKTGGEIVGITNLGKRLLVSSNDNFTYLFSLKSGKKTWKRKLAGRLIGKVILDDKVAVFLSSGSNVAIFLDLASGVIVNRLTLEKNLNFISDPLILKDTLIFATSGGLKAYRASSCTNNKTAGH